MIANSQSLRLEYFFIMFGAADDDDLEFNPAAGYSSIACLNFTPPLQMFIPIRYVFHQAVTPGHAH